MRYPVKYVQIVVQDMFIKYYDAVIPLLSNILLHATEKTHRAMRAKALECITLVGMAVGKDRFRTGESWHFRGE